MNHGQRLRSASRPIYITDSLVVIGYDRSYTPHEFQAGTSARYGHQFQRQSRRWDLPPNYTQFAKQPHVRYPAKRRQNYNHVPPCLHRRVRQYSVASPSYDNCSGLSRAGSAGASRVRLRPSVLTHHYEPHQLPMPAYPPQQRLAVSRPYSVFSPGLSRRSGLPKYLGHPADLLSRHTHSLRPAIRGEDEWDEDYPSPTSLSSGSLSYLDPLWGHEQGYSSNNPVVRKVGKVFIASKMPLAKL